MRLPKTLLSLFIVLLLGGTACSDLFSGSDSKPSLQLSATNVKGDMTIFNGDTLIFEPFDDYLGQNPPFQSTVKNNSIIISGYFSTSCVGEKPMGNIKANKRLKININSTKDEDCLTMPSNFIYDAIIRDIEPGTHQIDIIHKGDVLRSYDSKPHEVFSKEFVIE